MGLFSLVVYGVGDMVGAGIYGTIGVAAGFMGNAVWLAFVVSMVTALLTGLSYASLGSRYPKAGGAAYVTYRAYKKPFLSYVIGLAVAASGVTSMAAGTRVFAATLNGTFPTLPVFAIIVGFLLFLTVINVVGIRESMVANLICTVVEVGGLLFIIAVGMKYWGSVDYLKVPEGSGLTATMLLSGAVLTFYAFVGFEDMLNVSEEVKNPEHTMPWGILIALCVATLLYIAVSITAVSVVPAQDLADATKGAPMTQITASAAPWVPAWIYNVITLFAVANTALLNYVMGSRMLYGMARQGLVPSVIGKVSPTFRTPHLAILTLGILVLILVFTGDISALASATSLLLLASFCLVNGSLIVLKRRKGEAPGRFEIPSIIPLLGLLVCVLLIVARVMDVNNHRAPLIAAVIIAGLSLMYAIMRPKGSVEKIGETSDSKHEG
jgi:basic amino acid/polyamine antiporter, APA family